MAPSNAHSHTHTRTSLDSHQMAADAKAIVAANCIRSLHEGATFREWKKDKKKDDKKTYYHLALSPDERELLNVLLGGVTAYFPLPEKRQDLLRVVRLPFFSSLCAILKARCAFPCSCSASSKRSCRIRSARR